MCPVCWICVFLHKTDESRYYTVNIQSLDDQHMVSNKNKLSVPSYHHLKTESSQLIIWKQ